MEADMFKPNVDGGWARGWHLIAHGCTGDQACIRLSGCSSLSLKRLDDPLRDDPVASIDQSCVGCGNCGEVADAAVLCPSFYRADVVHNPSRFERRWQGASGGIMRWLQNRRLSKRLVFTEGTQ